MSDSWPEIASFANLCRAANRAARGKRRARGAARFLERLEPEALTLFDELERGVWRPSKPAEFLIHDPKERWISAAPFRDRVVHHALIDPLETRLDAALVPDTFACRRGKGTHAALRRARELVAGHAWYLKLDAQKCFESIEHAVVMETLAPLGLGARVMELCARILAGHAGRLGRGLPIGNLTSQWFANLLLGRVDRLAMALPGVGGYVRYMDDFVLFGPDKAELRVAHARVREFLAADLRLRIKERATVLAPTSIGLPFLGWRVFAGTTRIGRKGLSNLRRRVRRRRFELRTARIGPRAFEATANAVVAHLRTGDTLELRRGWLARLDVELGSGCRAPPTA